MASVRTALKPYTGRKGGLIKNKKTTLTSCLQQAGLVLSAFLWVMLLMGNPAHSGDINVILIETMPVKTVLEHSRHFVKQFADLGYTTENGTRLIKLDIKGDRAYGESLLRRELDAYRPDLVVTNATLASQIARKMLKGTSIPQVFFTVSDPVGAGLVEVIGEPTQSNITGIVHMINRHTRISMVLDIVRASSPKSPVTMGFVHSNYPSAMGDIRELKQAAQSIPGIIFISEYVDYINMPAGKNQMLAEARQAVRKLDSRIDFWWEPSGPLGELDEYTTMIMEESDKPILMGTKLNSVKLGALLHLTPHPQTTGKEAALMADAILKGKDSGSIPVLPPSSFDLGVNITTALKNNMVISQHLLELAGDQIFK
jgi:putative ABC transport system substrate-binding protein